MSADHSDKPDNETRYSSGAFASASCRYQMSLWGLKDDLLELIYLCSRYMGILFVYIVSTGDRLAGSYKRRLRSPLHDHADFREQKRKKNEELAHRSSVATGEELYLY